MTDHGWRAVEDVPPDQEPGGILWKCGRCGLIWMRRHGEGPPQREELRWLVALGIYGDCDDQLVSQVHAS